MDTPPELTPAQRRLLDQLRKDAEPLVFDADFVDDVVRRAQEVVDEAARRFAGERVVVSKGFLNQVLACEAKHLLPDTFRWNAANARGFVSHKAIELGVHWQGETVPELLVDEALARLADQPSNQGDFVAGLSEGDRAELRAGAVERVTRFLQDFPPLPARSMPVFEARTRWPLTGPVELVGKTDLVIGRPDGRVSTKLVIDFKSGWPSPAHRHDLRFYALLETLARRVPPRRLVTFYLDSAEADVEDVTEGVIEAALARLEGALARHAELVVDQQPAVYRPASACRWCPGLAECDDGRAHLRALDDDGRQGFDD
ncbi:MAG: PD-(D/E)XK nuclease family protein [Acidimicrobiales bacterium]|nr:PD-(D/E)XK nuclease family protein [Acidimicrobiales bacterium]